MGDFCVIACGLESGELARKVGRGVFLLGVQGWSVSVSKPEEMKHDMRHLICDDTLFGHVSQVGQNLRHANYSGLGFDPFSNHLLNRSMTRKVLQSLARKTQFAPSQIHLLSSWTHLRPVSSDDVPIISPLQPFSNLYVNAGHGGRG